MLQPSGGQFAHKRKPYLTVQAMFLGLPDGFEQSGVIQVLSRDDIKAAALGALRQFDFMPNCAKLLQRQRQPAGSTRLCMYWASHDSWFVGVQRWQDLQ